MENLDLVSIIVPAHNCEKYLEKCVVSLVAQTYKNIEIVICDDASTDNTYEVMKKLKKKFNNIILLQNRTNCKAGQTRNKCIQNSNGKYIVLQDADDYSSLNRIEVLTNYIKQKPEMDYISSGMYRFDENGIWQESLNKEKQITNIDIVKGCPVCHATTLFRKEALESVNGYRISNETIRNEDYDLFYRLYLNKKNGYQIKEKLYYYRENKETFSRKKYKYRVDEFKIRKRYFKKMKVPMKYMVYIFKPLIIGLIPIKLLRTINKRRGITGRQI